MQPQNNFNPSVETQEFKVGTNLVPLPSKGIFYENRKDSVLIEYMTASDENILSTPNFISSGTVFEQLLKRKIKDTDINIDTLLTGDVNAILLALRVTAYGSEYPVTVVDSENGQEFEEIVDLGKLNYKDLSVMPDEEFMFSFTTPIGKNKIKFRLLSNKEEKIVSDKVESLKKYNKGVDDTLTERLTAQIMEIDGNRDKLYISRFVKIMRPLDALKLRNYITEVEPNLDMTYEFTNPNTGRRFRTGVLFTARLFYPSI